MESNVASQPHTFRSQASFGAEIIDYSLNGDTLVYNSHCFTVRVFIGQTMYYVSRSYSAFCELDARLHRKYPRTRRPLIPLAGARMFHRRASIKTPLLAVKDFTEDIQSGAALSLSNTPTRAASIRRVDSNSEVIAQKKGPLNTYLQFLLTIPDFLTSDILLQFLNGENAAEEAGTGGEGDDLTGSQSGALEVSPVDLLLTNEEWSKKIVLRKHKVPLQVSPNSVLVYAFKTREFDIGFSVKKDNETEIVTYQRLDAHLKKISGHVEVPSGGQVTLMFDNTYSLLRHKSLSFVCKVVTVEDFQASVKSAGEMTKEKQLIQQRRNLLKGAMAKLAKEISSSSSSSSPGIMTTSSSEESNERDSFAEVENEFDVVRLREAIKKLRDEKQSLQRALEASESACVEESVASAELASLLDQTTLAKDALEQDLAEARAELEEWEKRLAKQASEPNYQKEYETISETLEETRDTLRVTQDKNKELELLVSRLKAEKKQLKTYALQLKNENEQLKSENDTFGHERIMLKGEIKSLQTACEELKKVNEDIGWRMANAANLKAERDALLIGRPTSSTLSPSSASILMGEEQAETILTSMEKGVSSLIDALKMGSETSPSKSSSSSSSSLSSSSSSKKSSTPLLSSNFGF